MRPWLRAVRHRARAVPVSSAWLALGVVVAIFLVESWPPRPQIDDAYISYQYARNLVAGKGLVFNPGEYVEGYTNLLWTLLVACGLALGGGAERIGWLLGVTSGAATLVGTYVYARATLREHAWGAAVAAGIVLASTPFDVWCFQGMETPLFAAAVTATLAAQAHGRVGWATAFAVGATLTRPEGMLLATVVLGLRLVEVGPWDAATRRSILAYGVAVALLTVFRLVYYGAPLPNTFYAKVGGVPVTVGLSDLRGFILDGAGWLVVPAVVGVAAERRLRPGAVFVVACAAYVVAIGGDAFGQWRFFVPLLPALAVFAVRGVVAAYRRSRTAGIVVAATIPIAASWMTLGSLPLVVGLTCAALAAAWASRVGVSRPWLPGAIIAALALALGIFSPAGISLGLPESKRAKVVAEVVRTNSVANMNARRLVEKLLRERPRPTLVAAGGVGRVGYFSQLPILDILGVIDPAIARSREARDEGTVVLPGHQRSNAAYVLARAPDYFVIPRRGTFLPLPALVAIWEHPGFQARYVWDSDIEAYRRRDIVPRPASQADAGPTRHASQGRGRVE